MASSLPYARLLECVHCGLCLPACPTYLELGDEADSPRGRIHLMRQVADGHLRLDADVVRHLDRCLGCLACESACPSGVRYRELIESARAAVEASYARPWWDRVRRYLVLALFAYPRRVQFLLWPVRIADLLGLGRWLRTLPFAALLPVRLPPRTWDPPTVVPAAGRPRYRVSLFRGCVARVLFPRVEAALVRVLSAHGCEVRIPRGQGCCGALAAHQGRPREADQWARRAAAVFREPADAILVTAAGCGAFLRTFAETGGDQRDTTVQPMFGGPVRDAVEFLAGVSLSPPSLRFPYRVAYHHACHLVHASKVREEPLDLLRIAGAQIVPLEEADVCCGSAGSYNLLQPALAERLGKRKAERIAASGAEVVTVANPGCALQIAAALRAAGHVIPVVHPVEILDATYRGEYGWLFGK